MPTFLSHSLDNCSGNKPSAEVTVLSSRKKSAPVQVLDPYDMHSAFPKRWRAYLQAHYRSHIDVARAFAVCEKAARKWWDGDGGPRGDKVAVAMQNHPDSAPVYLFGIAAE